MSQSEQAFAEKEQKLLQDTKRELEKMQEQLSFAKQQLQGASLEMQRVGNMQQEILEKNSQVQQASNVTVKTFNGEIEYDQPKDAREYIPETSYVSGYLLGGLAVSTALNTADENAPPVAIRLTDAGNLPKNFAVDLSTCRILGSAYGDLSSERAIIRAEKMVCIDPKTQLVTTSKIIGTIHGSDGMNGIKGKVVATSSKHIRNAMIGGVISGLATSAKGQEGMNITSLGAMSTKKKGIGDLAGQGLLTGTSTAAEKVADYYLRMAESMSPILLIPGGTKVDVMFMKGFFIGELGTHKKVRDERMVNKNTPKEPQFKTEERDE
jgi:conjugal transfer pilus assembly protein TraB